MTAESRAGSVAGWAVVAAVFAAPTCVESMSWAFGAGHPVVFGIAAALSQAPLIVLLTMPRESKVIRPA